MKKSLLKKDSINKLYKFIDKIISQLEDELFSSWSEKLGTSKNHSVDTLDKLVNLIVKLNKLYDSDEDNFEMSDEDEKIIQRFLEKNGVVTGAIKS